MKFKGTVIGLLAAILVVNTVMAGILATEAKRQTVEAEKQTKIELTQTKLMIENGYYEGGFTDLGSWNVALWNAQQSINQIHTEP